MMMRNTFGFAACGDVSTTELIVNVRLVGFQARGRLKVLNAALDVAFL